MGSGPGPASRRGRHAPATPRFLEGPAPPPPPPGACPEPGGGPGGRRRGLRSPLRRGKPRGPHGRPGRLPAPAQRPRGAARRPPPAPRSGASPRRARGEAEHRPQLPRHSPLLPTVSCSDRFPTTHRLELLLSGSSSLSFPCWRRKLPPPTNSWTLLFPTSLRHEVYSTPSPAEALSILLLFLGRCPLQ
ncbi:uncharacterized protein LJ206_004109 [Theristicus caerulescens]